MNGYLLRDRHVKSASVGEVHFHRVRSRGAVQMFWRCCFISAAITKRPEEFINGICCLSVKCSCVSNAYSSERKSRSSKSVALMLNKIRKPHTAIRSSGESEARTHIDGRF